jgi:diadenosine tetraphosphate (Ap4A) HIT family hydrolase
LCVGADPAARSALQRLLAEGRSRFIAQTSRFVAVPTYGCFVPGYVLVVPRTHVLSFGQLNHDALAEADDLVRTLAERMTAVYGMPVLGFEYGISARSARRIEHAHWHLLPSRVDLRGWLERRMVGRPANDLPALSAEVASYIAVRDQGGALTVFDVDDPAPHRRIRLRRVVAALDPRVNATTWDWASQRFVGNIRRTINDLGPAADVTGEDR